MTRFQTLLACGLPINWTTLLVGWQTGYATTEDVKSYAGDQLTSSSGTDAYRVFRLYDAAPTNTWEISDWLLELAGDEAGARDTARRTWDLALLKPLLSEMTDDPDSGEEMLEALYALTDFWAERGYPPHSPHTVQGRGNDITPGDYFHEDNHRHILEAHCEWIAQEEAALCRKPIG
jgi:hypothetical protein